MQKEPLAEENDADFSYNINQFLEMMVENKASDLIVKVGSPPAFRIDGTILKADMEALKQHQVEKLARDFLTSEEVGRVISGHEFDGSHAVSGLGRFRVNAFMQRETMAMVFRYIEDDILNFSELHLPEAIEKITRFERGLVLITGTTSSGKSTTLASLIDHINRTQRKHIITIEDPIEFVHKDRKSIVTQREIGLDTQDFSSALKYVLRQDPDIILLGEMRDQETVEAAMEAAETGHLVFSTLHTNSAAQTVNRIIDFFPKKEQEQIRILLAEHLQAVAGQRLLARKDTDGMIPAVELMFNIPIIKKLIEDDRVSKLRSAIHQGENEGMQTFDQALVELYNNGFINEDQAKRYCSKPSNFEKYVSGHYPDVDMGVLGGLR
ncbi:MAG: type IV pilus twitching motility protein PilT [bacterium]